MTEAMCSSRVRILFGLDSCSFVWRAVYIAAIGMPKSAETASSQSTEHRTQDGHPICRDETNREKTQAEERLSISRLSINVELKLRYNELSIKIYFWK